MTQTAAEEWSILHFSLPNPAGEGQQSVARLLHRLGETLEEMGEVVVQDIVFAMDVDEDGEDWPTATVYYHRASEG